jgi:hypothetical protein
LLSSNTNKNFHNNLPPEEGDLQDTFIEVREPAELTFCIILAAAFAGIAKYCWLPLFQAGNLYLFIFMEGFCITIVIWCLITGLRPYTRPAVLQVSTHGIKYSAPYWLPRKTINWDQIFRLYISPELVIILYHPLPSRKGIRIMLIELGRLSDNHKVSDSILKYSKLDPTFMANPGWITKAVQLILYGLVILWIVRILVPVS